MKFQHLPAKPEQDSFSSASSVWVRPTADSFSWEDIQTLFLAFEPRKCVAHRSWRGKPQEHADSSQSEISITSCQMSYTKGWTFCNSKWIDITSEDESVSSFLEGDAYKSAPSLAFFPRDLSIGHKWSQVSQGLWWLWGCESFINSSPTMKFDAVLESFIRMTLDLGGFPGLCWIDWDTDIGITFWMPLSQAIDFARNLQGLDATEEDLWSPLNKSGFYFDLCRSRLGY